MFAQHVAEHAEWHRGIGAGVVALGCEVIDQSRHGAQFPAHFGCRSPVCVNKEAGQHIGAQSRRPLARPVRGLRPVIERERQFTVAQKTAKTFVVGGAGAKAPTVQGARRDVVEQHVGAGVDGIAEQQPAQAVVPVVVGRGGHVQFRTVRGVEAPADARPPHGIADAFQVMFADAEAGAYRGRAQRRQHRVGRIARAGQFQQVEERGQRGTFVEPPAADLEADPARGAEHRRNDRRIGVEVRRQHQHVRGLDVGILVEHAEQPVVEHLDFASRGVADVDLNGVVRGEGCRWCRWCRWCRGAKDLCLHGAEAGVAGWLVVRRGLVRQNGCLLTVQQCLHVACRPAPSLQQLVLLGVVAAGFARRDVGPEIPARAEQEQVDVHHRGGKVEHREK